MKTAVVVVDVQGDFTEWAHGSLAVPSTGPDYIEQVQRATERLSKYWPVFATQDWHPPDHISFYTNHPGRKPLEAVEVEGRTQVLWPPHCVHGTQGAKILIDNNLFLGVIQKGRDRRYDSYSGFKDDGGNPTELDSILRLHGIERIILYGLATDYCVRATALDARALGYEVWLVEDLSRGVSSETTEGALREMANAGVRILTLKEAEALVF